MRKVGFVAATAAGLMLLGGGVASADQANVEDLEADAAQDAVPTSELDGVQPDDGNITYEEAYRDFQEGGAAAGYGAASMVAAAYTGVSLTPAHMADSVSD